MTAVLVVLGAIVGAPLRYLVDRGIQSRHRTLFPWGTISVNVAACVGLGLTTGAVAAGVTTDQLQALLATGLCATLSTYSTFSYETLRLIEQRKSRYAAANIAISVLAGLGAAALGELAAGALWT